MRNLLNPKWIFIINTIPVAVLLFLFIGEFNIIKSLLDDESIRLWKIFGFTLSILAVLNFAYAVFLTLKKKVTSILYAAIALLCYIPFIYLYSIYSDKILPFNIPQWMIPDNLLLYVGTFLMPTLAYSLFVLVVHFTPQTSEHKAWKSFLIAIIIPVSWYLFSQILLPLWQRVEADFGIHAIIILTIAGTIIFLFFLIRAIYILITKKNNVLQKYQLAWKIPVSILLPVLGLAVNNGYLTNWLRFGDSGIFGDFSSYWFYSLAILNGILICMPNIENKWYRIILFAGRSIGFAYTMYFFLVFLPFLPLSVIAIAAVGIGFLMLTPLLLFVIHVHELSKDFVFIKNNFSKNIVWCVAVLSFITIPAFISFDYLNDKKVLLETLDYLYSPDYSKKYNINKHSLKNTIDVVKHHKDNNRSMIFGSRIPYLSSYFNWLVLDNLTLSDSKINRIENIFFGSKPFDRRAADTKNTDVKITNINTESIFDKSQNAGLSRVDLEITNNGNNGGFAEYTTTFDLPEGCWITDYYLYVGNKKEMGILAEKKSAMWVYTQIRNTNKDPGILYYLSGNKVAFGIFPFGQHEIRKTGIEFLHKEPISITIDNNSVKLGNDEETGSKENSVNDHVIYISARQKQALRKVQRKPYFHFLLDISKDKGRYSTDFTKRIEQFLQTNKAFAANAKLSFVNSYVSSVPLTGDWKKTYQSKTFEGAFFLDRAIRTTLVNSSKEPGGSYPVIVVITDSIKNSVLDADFTDLKITFPESSLFFDLDENEKLHPHSLIKNPLDPLSDSIQYSFAHTVLEYRSDKNIINYLPDNNQPDILLKKDLFDVKASEIKEKNWQSALTMQGKWISLAIHPETSEKEWLNLVKYSFISKVMTPVTSYLVVENEAQKAILKKKQEQVLSANKSLDLGEDPLRMSEPGLILLTILLLLVLWYKKKSRQRVRN